MWKKITKYTIFYSVLIVTFFYAQNVEAEVLPVTGNPSETTGEYSPLAGIPGLNANGSFDDYINSLYALSIAIAGLLAVVKIIIAGVKWMTSDIVTNRIKAKKDIQGAVFGLLVVLAAVIILNTVNTDLTKTDLDYKSDENRVGVGVEETKDDNISVTGTEITVGSSKVIAIKIDSSVKEKRNFENKCLSDLGGVIRTGIVSGSNIEIGPRCVIGRAQPFFDTENNKVDKVCTNDAFVNKVIWCEESTTLKQQEEQ